MDGYISTWVFLAVQVMCVVGGGLSYWRALKNTSSARALAVLPLLPLTLLVYWFGVRPWVRANIPAVSTNGLLLFALPAVHSIIAGLCWLVPGTVLNALNGARRE